MSAESEAERRADWIARQGEDRPLGPEMVAEGWRLLGGDGFLWSHVSGVGVVVDGPMPRKTEWCDTLGVPAVPSEPADPATEGYIVRCERFDEHGNPTEGECFWVESYTAAVRHARAMRAQIVAKHAPPKPTQQLTLDDVGGSDAE